MKKIHKVRVIKYQQLDGKYYYYPQKYTRNFFGIKTWKYLFVKGLEKEFRHPSKAWLALTTITNKKRMIVLTTPLQR